MLAWLKPTSASSCSTETVGARRSGISPDIEIDDEYLWYEIGSHADDDRMID
jgi:hypothetical protein